MKLNAITVRDSGRVIVLRGSAVCKSIRKMALCMLINMSIGATLMLFNPSFSRAQVVTADILGTVADASGAVVPDAKAILINTGTGIVHEAITNKTGEYVFNLLQIGSYELKVEKDGFKSFKVSNITLSAGDRARINAKLDIGEVSESVSVSASETPILQSDSSTISSLIDDQAVQDVPLNGRNVVNLIELSAGVTEGNSNAFGSGTRAQDRRMSSAFSVNGQSDNANTNLIDGMDNNERLNGVIGVRPSIDAVQQVKVVTNLYTAEIGRTRIRKRLHAPMEE